MMAVSYTHLDVYKRQALNLDDEILTIPAANFTQLSGMRQKPRESLIVIP